MTKAIKPYLRCAHYYETDKMGIVHHSNYIRWFEEARLDYSKQAGIDYKKMESDHVLMPVTTVSCRYLIPVRFDEAVEIDTKLAFFNGIRITYHYEIYTAADHKLAVTGESGHCFVDENTRRPFNLKKCRPDLYDKTMLLLKQSENETKDKEL
jgi:acyl-CoA thioester hydrolase